MSSSLSSDQMAILSHYYPEIYTQVYGSGVQFITGGPAVLDDTPFIDAVAGSGSSTYSLLQQQLMSYDGSAGVQQHLEFTGGQNLLAAAPESEMKPKRRRRKNKGESSNSGFREIRKLSDEQVNMLELHFSNEHKLESKRKDRLASELGLDPRQVAVWFQNRRARWKSKKLKEEYSRLKSEHECTIFQTCQLKTEVQTLKERLSEAEKNLNKVAEQSSGPSSYSQSSSLLADIMEPPFLGEFGMEGMENVLCAAENNYDTHGLVYWPDLYDI